MTEDARLYRVRWEIEVEAETPLQAAQKALHTDEARLRLRRCSRWPRSPYAIRRHGDPVTIDLSPDSC